MSESNDKPLPMKPPANMDQLLDTAHNLWKFKRRDEAIVVLIGGMRLLSQGVAKALIDLEEIKKEKEGL